MGFERIAPGTPEWQAYYANHIFRYQFAGAKLLAEKRMNVLDAACGVGFGAHSLANIGIPNVTAIDRSVKALEIARSVFSHPNIRYLVDDCHTLEQSAAFGPFDGIVSIETLEHLPRPEEFIKACYSRLKQGGILIVTTPNAAITSPDGNVTWEFHEQEYKYDELKALLEKHGFQDVTIAGQAYSSIGKLRDDVRAELNRINSNPFARTGRLLQQLLRKRKFEAVLPEQVEDFVVIDQASVTTNPPFVLMAVAYK